MLPPQLRQGLVLARHQAVTTLALKTTTTSLLRAGTAYTSSRRFWHWRRGNDWSSHLDPLYHRFARIRTLKTRAKLLQKLKRRGKFEWDLESKPFFTPKHVRWASHWDGTGRRSRLGFWNEQAENDAKDKTKGTEEGKVAAREDRDGDGYELSQREKIWKEQMEKMRKRIESDPYEAIFGKRFEPFWSPLVPSWMREEMGLQGWPKKPEKDTLKQKAEDQVKVVKNETAKSKDAETLSSMSKEQQEQMKLDKEYEKAHREHHLRLRAKDMEEQLRAMQTSRKQVMNDTAKAKQAETSVNSLAELQKKLDERMGEMKGTARVAEQPTTYSYASSTSWDSLSNKTRRVEWDSASGQTKKFEYDPISNRMVQIEAPKPVEAALSKTPDTKNAETPVAAANWTSDSKAVNIPVRQSSDVRKSIPIPPPLSQPSHSVPIGFTPAPTSIGPLKSTAVSADVPKPSALAKLPASDLDMLTADNVRAKMGKVKAIDPSAKATTAEEKAQMEQDFEKKASARDPEIDAILKERDLAKGKMASKNTNTQWDQAEMGYILDRELESLQKKKDKLIKDERGLFHIERQKRELQKLDDRIKEVIARVDKLSAPPVRPVPFTAAEYRKALARPRPTSPYLQPSLDRMSSKEKELSKNTEPDDAAAHESTEPIAALNAVPKNWSQQADLLQADRVRRTAAKISPTHPIPRFAEVMQARKSAYEARKVEAKAKEDAANAEQNAKLEKANAMLEAEVKEVKFMMQSHENRYAHKIRSLRQELEVAYKQSTVHSEKHLERIRDLEKELGRVQKAAGETGQAAIRPKVDAVKEIDAARMKEKAEQKARDQALVKEVREIYEKRYGTIDAAHRQPKVEAEVDQPTAVLDKKPKQVVEVESDVDLGEALAKYEKEQPESYAYQKDNLEKEVAAKENAYYNSISSTTPTLRQTIAENLEKDHERKLVDDTVPKLIPTELAKPSHAPPEAQPPSIRWQDPPMYKVLAYDSGNDMMSTATTTSNFSGTEAPISISQALSQLYQPARFVPYFAELQSDGYQVIFGTKDLLLFKKVAKASASPSTEAARAGLEDHGLMKVPESRVESVGKEIGNGKLEQSLKESIAKVRNRITSAVNPVDGTTKYSAEARETEEANNAEYVAAKAEVYEARSRADADQAAREFRQPSKIEEDEDVEYRHYPRVYREEPHFTGTRRKWNSSHRRHQRAEERNSRFYRKKRRSAFRWILGAGLGGAGVMYLVGAAAEKSRMSSKDEWQRKALEQRSRWVWNESKGKWE